MRDLASSFLHLLATVARLAGLGGARSNRARETPRQGHTPSGHRVDSMNRPPLNRSWTSRGRVPGVSAGADVPAGAPALTYFTATDRPTTATECCQVVGDTPLLTLRRQKCLQMSLLSPHSFTVHHSETVRTASCARCAYALSTG